jgi:creatinine amidohydrolase
MTGPAALLHLADMTWPEIAAAASRNCPVVLTIGACEQHGPHLPVSTDSILPVAVAERASATVPLVIAPPVTYGACSRPLIGGGESFPGTVSLRAATLMAFLKDVLCGLAKSGFRQIVVLNWHLENAGYLWEACDLAAASSPNARFLLLENPFPDFSPGQVAEIFPQGLQGWEVEHASVVETSMMMVVRPDLLRRDRIIDDSAERSPSWDVIPAPAAFVPRSGVLARASHATEQAGHVLLNGAVGRLIEDIQTEFDLDQARAGAS